MGARLHMATGNAPPSLADKDPSLDATMADPWTGAADAPPTPRPPDPAPGPTAPPQGVRTTILPRIQRKGEVPELVHPRDLRYQPLRRLGSGGVGEVSLVQDNDIERRVALKRLHPGCQTTDAVIRFIEEIHTIGQLDHPGIVPIHDVGVDEHGGYFFIMKYAEGETLEGVIDKLAAGDETYLRRFTIERRVQIFTQVLRAVEFAHARGFIHRDLKPANIMIGAYGEVTVMDWGLAKRVRRAPAGAPPDRAPAAGPGAAPPQADPPPPGAPAEPRERLFTTQHGALLGTPAYMSPEQAAARNDELDERSDIYSLCVILHELLTLKHYLGGQTTLRGMLFAILYQPPVIPLGGGVPPELAYFLQRGLHKDPAQRFASVGEMINELALIEDGQIRVQCPFTGMRRGGQAFLHLVNARPIAALLAFAGTAALTLYGGAMLAAQLLR